MNCEHFYVGRQTRTHPPSDVEVAWAAGLFDGEGTIFAAVEYRPRRSRPQVRLKCALSMTTPDVVRRFHQIVGVGVVRPIKKEPGNRKFQSRWEAWTGEEIHAAIAILWPYLSNPKREQAAAAFADKDMWLALPPLPLPPQNRKRRVVSGETPSLFPEAP
jgi:hypothetical protein